MKHLWTTGAYIAHALGSPLPIRRQETALDWGSCNDKVESTDALPFDCATYNVPLDYTKPESDEELELKLVRIRATDEPFLGSVFFNPGGPGYAGRQDLYAGRELWQTVVGKQFDIIAWDYRGTGTTLPFSCFATEAERTAYLTAVGFGDATWKASDTALGTMWATQQWQAEACAQNANSSAVGELIGTAFTARDMMQLVDAVGEDGMLRFWGISYGTALGATAAKMFPDRVDKVVLDAVLDPNEYYAGRDVSQVTYSDATLEAFFAECMKAPHLCPLAASATSAEELASEFWSKLEEYRTDPPVFGSLGMEKWGRIKSTIFRALYGAAGDGAVSLATYLDAILTKNATTYGEYLLSGSSGSAEVPPFPDYSPVREKENYPGIRCSDQSLRTDGYEELVPLLTEFAEESTLNGDSIVTTQTLNCAQWPFRAKERPEGKFENIKTKNPLLFVNGRFDPATSLAAAHMASKAFVGSRVLEHNGLGHASLAQLSLCTIKAYRAYLTDGTLPEESKVCETDNPAFTTADGLEVVRRKLAEEGLW